MVQSYAHCFICGRVCLCAQEVTWGVAYEVRGHQHVQQALEHLYVRENSNGGYHNLLTTFYPRHPNASDDDDEDDDSDKDDDVTVTSEPFSVLSFTAAPSSQLYLGPADVTTMAQQVAAAHGQAGPNAEYVLRTAEYVRRHIPEDQDRHLFELERVVRKVMASVKELRRSSVRHSEHTALSSLQTVTVPV